MGVGKDQFIAQRGGAMLAQQRECDHALAARPHLIEEFGFEIVRDGHLAGGDLLRRCADEAELTMADAFCPAVIDGADGRAEDAAGHGTPCVNVAAAGGWVERGAWRVVGEVVEAGPLEIGCSEHAGLEVAREVRPMFGEPGAGAALDPGGERWIGGAQFGHTSTQTLRIKRVDGEGAVTALHAADSACEKRAGAAGCVGESRVDDLDQFGIARGEGHERKDNPLGTPRLRVCRAGR